MVRDPAQFDVAQHLGDLLALLCDNDDPWRLTVAAVTLGLTPEVGELLGHLAVARGLAALNPTGAEVELRNVAELELTDLGREWAAAFAPRQHLAD